MSGAAELARLDELAEELASRGRELLAGPWWWRWLRVVRHPVVASTEARMVLGYVNARNLVLSLRETVRRDIERGTYYDS